MEYKYQKVLRTKKKTCTGCVETKPISEFFTDKSTKDGLRHYCKVCHMKRSQKYLNEHPEKRKKYNAKFLQENPDYQKRVNELQNKRRKANPEQAKHYELKCHHGITLDDYNALLRAQNYKCAICGREAKNLKRDLSVDHDHEKKLIRGLLCDGCNIGLGLFKDSVISLRKAIKYLIKKRSIKNALAHGN